jgi:hypothetical protein
VVRTDASPLGPTATVPVLEFPVVVCEWAVVIVELSGAPIHTVSTPSVDIDGSVVAVAWPDGQRTTTHIPDPRPAAADR